MRVVVLCLFVCLSVSVSQVCAVPVTFDFSTSSSRNSYFESLEYAALGTSLEIYSEVTDARVTQKFGGLGVSIPNDNSTTLDGSVGFDSLTFWFSSIVTLTEVQFSYFDDGDEFSLIAASANEELDIPTDSGLVYLSLIADRFIFGVTDAGDAYRIESITVDIPDNAPVPAPEPSTWLLLSVGIGGLAYWRQRQ